MHSQSLRTLSAITVVALVTAACSSISDTVTERVVEEAAEAAAEQGVEVDLDTDNGGITVETDEGTVSIGGDGALPEAFPSSLPLPSAYAVAGSMSQAGEDGESLFVTLTTDDDPTALVETLAAGLESGGWTVTDTSEMSSAGFSGTTWSIEGEGYEGTVSVNAVGEDVGTQVVYAVERRPAS